MKYISIQFVLIVLLSLNCSGLKEVNDMETEVKIVEVNSWLNLMPGFSPGSFHLSGEFAVYSAEDNPPVDIKLKEVFVYYSDELLYIINPIFKYSRTEPDFSVSPKRIDVYQFFNEDKIEIKEVLMAHNIINIELKFLIEDEEVNLKVDDIEVTRAY